MRRSQKTPSSVESRKRSNTAAKPRKFAPGVERLEARELLANSFLQGLVFHDVNGNGVYDNPPSPGTPEPLQAGVTVRLLRGSDGVQLRTTTTGADGYYFFGDLAPGNYRLIQDSPTGFFASGAQVQSQLNPGTIPAGTSNRIDVDLVDPDVLNVDYTYVFGDYRHLYRGVQLRGRIPEAFIRYPDEAPVGQIPVTVTRNMQPFLNTFTYCMDLDEPEGEPIEFPVGDFRPEVQRGPIGYLFNRYGLDRTLSLDQKAGLQLAIWEFLYDPGAGMQNLRAGTFQYILPPAQFPTVEASANGFIQEAMAKSEPALFLRMNEPFVGEPRSQSWLGTGSFNFGNRPRASLEGHKWHDQNANGRWDTSEPGLNNWVIQALQNGQVIASATTDATGRYQIPNLLPGTYQIREIVQPGWTQSYPVNPNVHTVTLAIGQNFAGARLATAPPNFGNWLPGTLSGIVSFESPDCSLVQQQRGGQTGVGITLEKEVNPGQFQVAGNTTTGVNGTYQFVGLMPGTYRVSQQLQVGWTQLSGPGNLTVVSNQATTGANFRNRLPIDPDSRCGSITGRITAESQICVGFQNLGGRGGVTVYLDANNNGQVDPTELRTTTDVNGNFRLAPTGAGFHRVRVVLPNNATFFGRSGADYLQTGPFFAANDANFQLRFPIDPNLQCGFLAGRVTWQVPTCDGVSNQGGRGNVTVFLDANNNGQLDPSELRTTTDVNGNFRLAPTGAGTHRVRVVSPAGGTLVGRTGADYQQTGPFFGATDANFVLQFAPNEPLRCGSINGRVTYQVPTCTDPRNMGGLAGVTVYVDANNNSQLDAGEQRAVTGANGNYSITQVGQGNYVVRYVLGADKRAVGRTSAQVSQANERSNTGGVDFLVECPPPEALVCIPIIQETPKDLLPTNPGVSPPRLIADLGGKFQLLGSTIGQDPQGNAILSRAAFVTGLYHNILNRTPDDVGLVSWVQQLLAGTPRSQVVNAIYNSMEHRTNQVRYYYQTFLGRRTDPGGETFWVNSLATGAITEKEFVSRLLGSAEYYAKSNSSNATYVARLYVNIVGRQAEATGHQAWMAALQSGTTREAVALSFLSARESSRKVLDTVYSAYLDRRADPAGEQAWLNGLGRNQIQWSDVARAVLASDEYFNRLAALARRT